MTILDYKASRIATFERETGENFFNILDDLKEPSFAKIQFLWQAGGGSDENFDDIVEKEGLEGVFTKIFEALDASGFLGKKKLTPDFRKGVQAQGAPATKPSLKSGAVTKK